MKRLLITLTLLLSLAIPATSKSSNPSIMGLQWADEEGNLKNHCTTWSYVSKSGHQYWMTAAHCVMDEAMQNLENHDYKIGGMSVHVFQYNAKEDIAALIDGPEAEGFKISDHNPAVGDHISVDGHPFGFEELFHNEGIISALIKKFDDGTVYTAYQLPVAPGNSGSPVFNAHHEVIGVLQISFCGGLFWNGFCSESGGSPLMNLRGFVAQLK